MWHQLSCIHPMAFWNNEQLGAVGRRERQGARKPFPETVLNSSLIDATLAPRIDRS
jgi:hypothetical protein